MLALREGTVLVLHPSAALPEEVHLRKQNSISKWDDFLTGNTQEALNCWGTAER